MSDAVEKARRYAEVPTALTKAEIQEIVAYIDELEKKTEELEEEIRETWDLLEPWRTACLAAQAKLRERREGDDT